MTADPTPERPTPQDDAPEPPRHTPTVRNPCGATRDVLFVGDGVHVCEHIPDHARSDEDREHICCCGFVWDDSEAPAITPERHDHVSSHGGEHGGVERQDLRKRLAEVLNTTIVTPDGGIERSTDKFDRHDRHNFVYNCAACQGNVPAIISAVLAELVEPPGDLLAQMAAEIDQHHIDGGLSIGLLDADRCLCGEIVKNWPSHLAAAALSVRWEDAARRIAAAEALADHAEGELSSRQYHHARWETEKARADKAEEQLREERNRHRLAAEKDVCPGCMQREEQRDAAWETSRQNGVKYEQTKQAWHREQDRAQAAEAQVAAIRSAVVSVYGEEYGDEDVPAAVERLMRHLSEHETDVLRLRQAKNEALEASQAQVAALQRELDQMRAALPSRPDVPEEIRSLAQATTESTEEKR